MNSAGLAVTANSPMSSEDYVPISYIDRDGIYHEISPKMVFPLMLARRVFLQYRLFSEGLVAINAFPRHVSGNLHVATGDGFGIALEASPNRIYKVYGDIDDNCVIHTNHRPIWVSLRVYDVDDRSPGGSSWFRWQQVEKRIQKYRHGNFTPEFIKLVFLDHSNYPESVCSHPNFNQKNPPDNALTGYTSRRRLTVAFVMYDLTEKTITCCKGGPCSGVMQKLNLIDVYRNALVLHVTISIES
ncbi:hypothetical protein M433DRAFT_547447 [Acidomyces richmondensis BFW]|nr:MAG: hypothetical protein FE78DRAFT_536253 [Acidomyces sp. 'richmondensis']KYG41661.1 hypothetical protein M433DRAFT_547447 [Acidomyces richmondensis BFW]